MITFSKLGSYGRFGNQLFQIASTIGLAQKMDIPFIFPNWEYSKYFKNPIPQGNIDTSTLKTHVEQTTRFYEINLASNHHWDLEGYFQSYKYFDDYKGLIEYFFAPNFKSNDDIDNKVAVHVRRGDYLKLDNHPVLPASYYKKAMAKFKNRDFVIFSDDIDWCKKNFDHETSYFVMPTKLGDIGDFFYMKNFKEIIIANSSFSWWAAYLGEGKKIIAPSNYVKGEDSIEDRIPSDWIII